MRTATITSAFFRAIFAGTPLARMGIREFIQQAMRIAARLKPLEMDVPITLFPERERVRSSPGSRY